MPKLKTHTGAKKRVKLTKNGKVKRAHAFKRHLLNNGLKTRYPHYQPTHHIHSSTTRHPPQSKHSVYPTTSHPPYTNHNPHYPLPTQNSTHHTPTTTIPPSTIHINQHFPHPQPTHFPPAHPQFIPTNHNTLNSNQDNQPLPTTSQNHQPHQHHPQPNHYHHPPNRRTH